MNLILGTYLLNVLGAFHALSVLVNLLRDSDALDLTAYNFCSIETVGEQYVEPRIPLHRKSPRSLPPFIGI